MLDNAAFKSMERAIIGFYTALIPEVDRLAVEAGLPKITEECGIVAIIDDIIKRVVHIRSSGNDDIDFHTAIAAAIESMDSPYVGVLDFHEFTAVVPDHIEEDHSSYRDLFKTAMRTPSVSAHSDQMFAFVEDMLRSAGLR